MTLRIFFIGLVAFVPSDDGKELIVLLVDVRDGYFTSDGSQIPAHVPILLARASGCQGACGVADSGIAEFVFPDLGPAAAHDSLANALKVGAAWRLDDSELSLTAGSGGAVSPSPLLIQRNLQGQTNSLPRTETEKKDFSWVAALSRLDPQAAVDPDVLAPRPEKGLIAGRLRLGAGSVFTYRMVRIGDEVRPITFQTLKDGVKADYEQALADWVVAEVEVPEDAVRIVGQSFTGSSQRGVNLTAENGVVEVAILNVPQAYFELPATPRPADEPPEPGRHFEVFYELAGLRPPAHMRPVPYAATGSSVEWSLLHPREGFESPLLEGIRLTDPRGAYEGILCPVAQIP